MSTKSMSFSVGLCPTVRGRSIEVSFLELWECAVYSRYLNCGFKM